MHLVLRVLGLLMIRIFYRTIQLAGQARAPEAGPVVVVANHPNGLLDPLVARVALGRRLAFLAKSTFFRNPVGRAAMRAFDAIPVYRPRDGEDASKNERTFEQCRQLLHDRGWLMLFPEGTSHSDPSMRPLKTGAARIALSAEAQAGFRLGLRIVPVGLLYEDKEIFRTRAATAVGEAFGLERYAERYRTDERGAVEELTREIDERLSDVVLEADSQELWRGFLAVAAWTSADGGADLASRDARARALARAYRKLHAEDPARAAGVVEATRRYAQALEAVGVDNPFALETPVAPSVGALARFVVPVLTLWPFALLGLVFGWIPYRLVRVLTNLTTKDADLTGTMKGIFGLFLFTVFFVGEAVFAGVRFGWPAGLATFVAAPLTSYMALRWFERLSLRREALRGLWLRLSRADLTEAIRARRLELAGMVERELSRVGEASEAPVLGT